MFCKGTPTSQGPQNAVCLNQLPGQMSDNEGTPLPSTRHHMHQLTAVARAPRESQQHLWLGCLRWGLNRGTAAGGPNQVQETGVQVLRRCERDGRQPREGTLQQQRVPHAFHLHSNKLCIHLLHSPM